VGRSRAHGGGLGWRERERRGVETVERACVGHVDELAGGQGADSDTELRGVRHGLDNLRGLPGGEAGQALGGHGRADEVRDVALDARLDRVLGLEQVPDAVADGLLGGVDRAAGHRRQVRS
jgi:hypothetical protein